MKTLMVIVLVLVSPITSCVAQYGVTPESAGVQTYSYFRNTGKHAALETERKSYMAKILKLLPDSSRDTYAGFKRGYFVDSKGNRTQQYPMNYNKLLETIEYIDASGDTLALTDSHPARQIVTQVDRFVHIPGDGFFVLDSQNSDRVKLVFKEATRIVSSSELTDGNATRPKPSKQGQFIRLYVPGEPTLNDYEVLLDAQRFQCLMDENDRIYPANPRGFKQAFRKHSDIIENHINQRIREHSPIHFQNDSDLRELLEFCIRLEKMNLH